MTSRIAKKAALGTVLMVSQTVFGKAMALSGQLVLARLLAPESWGIFAMALAASAFGALVGQMGMVQVLVQRHGELPRLGQAAFWLSLTSGTVAALSMVILTPAWAMLMDEPRLVPVMLLLSVDVFFTSLTVVPSATLRSELRFGSLAIVGAIMAVIQIGLSILLAYHEFGALSFAIPKLLVTLIQLLIFWNLTKPEIKISFRIRQWPSLLKAGTPLLLAGLAFAATQQGDYVILGMVSNSKDVGMYFLAFTLSIQVTALLTGNVQAVLLPALSHAKDNSQVQYAQAQRATRLLALIVFPICVALSVAATPIVRLLFGVKWVDAAPILQILSLAAAFRVIVAPSAVLIQASGRFYTYLYLHVISSFIFIIIVTLLTYFVGVIGTALGVLIHSVLAVVIFTYPILRKNNNGLRSVIAPVAAPFTAALIAGLAAVMVSAIINRYWSESALIDFINLVAICIIGGAIYVGGAYLLAKKDILDLKTLAYSIISENKKGASHD